MKIFLSLILFVLLIPFSVAMAVCDKQDHIKTLTHKYISSFQGASLLEKGVLSDRVQEAIFCQIDNSIYIDSLRYLDALAPIYPDEIHALAGKLQRKWEVKFGLSLIQSKQQIEVSSTKIGAIAGISALGIIAITKPNVLPSYFKYFRYFLPAAGAYAGYKSSDVTRLILGVQVPPAPAQVMHLGIIDSGLVADETEIANDVMKILTSAGAGLAAYELLSAVKIAKWARINPVALVGSLVVGWVVDDGVEFILDKRDLRKKRSDVRSALKSLYHAHEQNDDDALFVAADALVKSTFLFAYRLSQPVRMALSEYFITVAEMEKRYGQGTKSFEEAIAPHNGVLKERLEKLLESPIFEEDSKFLGYEVRRLLKLGRFSEISILGQSAKLMADSFIRSFENWIVFEESATERCFAQDRKNELFKEFLNDIDRTQDALIAEEVRIGKMTEKPVRMLLQSAVTLRHISTQGKSFISSHSEELLALILENNILMMAARYR